MTPDSFSDGGLYATSDEAVAHGRRLAADGALVIDVGGESTRPGSPDMPVDIELDRVIPVITALAADGHSFISVDTRKPDVASAAIEAGAHLVNDVGGLRDPAMIQVCASAGVPAVVMHMRGTPIDMQIDPHYEDVVVDVTSWLVDQASRALAAGVPDVMVDPGIGFGKTVAHNLSLLRALPLTDRHLVLVGASRKRTVQQLAEIDPHANRDPGSIALHLFAAQRGVAMIRAHDVAGHHQALAVDRALRNPTEDR